MTTEERDALILAHMHLAPKVIASFKVDAFPHVTSDDLAQEAIVALIRCTARYQPREGVPFGAYAWVCMRGAVSEVVHRLVRRGGIASLDAPLDPSNPTSPSFGDLMPSSDPDVERYVGAHIAAENALAAMSNRERTIFVALSLGYPYHEVANQIDAPLGTLKSMVWRARDRVQRRLKPPKRRGRPRKNVV